MSQHTRGPWERVGERVIAPGARHYIGSTEISTVTDPATRAANAELFAAGPELVDALRGLVRAVETRFDNDRPLRVAMGEAQALLGRLVDEEDGDG